MQVKEVLQSRVVQIAKTPINMAWVPDLLREIGDKYEFTIVPKPEDLWKVAEPKAEFKHGRLGANIIDTFGLFHYGFVVDTTTSTENSEFFLNDLLQWLKTKVPTLKENGKPFYLSQLEVSLELGRFGKVLDSIGNEIFQLLAKYELLGVGPYAVSTLQLAQDPLGKIGPNLSIFGIERRRDIRYADNIFFAQAPLRTVDHKAMLEALEGVLASI